MPIHRLVPILLASLTVLPLAAEELSARVDRIDIEDGDTLIAEVDGVNERLQLAHIDAPEDADNAKLARDLQRTGLDRWVLLELGQTATGHLRELTNCMRSSTQ
ncbi:MAG: hypothetical protein U9Q81_17250 [Pseudomonadota bacterium]|nr:hypothetical protein [Pseudomonadota bacterium]